MAIITVTERDGVIESLRATEKRLALEADSLGDLLESLRECAYPLLIDAPAWGRVVARARELPVAMAALPFGFETPLHEPEQRADLGVTVTGGSRIAAFFKERAGGENADPASAGITRLLERMAREEALQSVLGTHMMLEYDIGSDLQGEEGSRSPGMFLYPLENALSGGRGADGLADFGLVMDVLFTATGWTLDKTEARLMQQVYGALTPELQILSVGAFPARGRGIRLGLLGIRETRALRALLERVGWPGSQHLVETVVSQLEQHRAFGDLVVHIDLGRQGIGPRLGVSCIAGDLQNLWRNAMRQPTNLLDVLRAEGYAVPEKLSALAQTPLGAQMLLTKTGAYTLARGVSHIKLTLARERVEQVKAYIFLLISTL